MRRGYKAGMNIPLRLATLLILFISVTNRIHAATALRHLGSAERVRHFERFRDRMPREDRPSNNAHDSSMRQWIWDRHALYRAHDAEHIIELFDLFFRRQGAFQLPEALDWLSDRLTAEWNKAPRPLSTQSRQALRMYSDVVLIFSTAPITRRLARPVTVLPEWSKTHDAVDALEYRAWANPVLKNFINDLADRVPAAPEAPVERARWFFTPYHPPCGAALE
jgi:hypothetical protein